MVPKQDNSYWKLQGLSNEMIAQRYYHWHMTHRFCLPKRFITLKKEIV